MTPSELQSFRDGDPDLFRRLVESLSSRLLGVASAYVDDVDVAHDVVQETWIRAYERRRQFQGRGSLVGWLITICRSVAIGGVRKAAARLLGITFRSLRYRLDKHDFESGYADSTATVDEPPRST